VKKDYIESRREANLKLPNLELDSQRLMESHHAISFTDSRQSCRQSVLCSQNISWDRKTFAETINSEKAPLVKKPWLTYSSNRLVAVSSFETHRKQATNTFIEFSGTVNNQAS